MKKIAVVGAGAWAEKMHLPILEMLQSKNHFSCSAIVDLNLERATLFANKLQAKAYTDFENMIASENIQGLVLLLPPGKSGPFQDMAAKYKLPFLAEKPPCYNAEEHLQLIDKTKHIEHLIAFNRRFCPYMQEFEKWNTGSFHSLSVLFNRYNRKAKDFSETAVHAIDTSICIAGRFNSIHIGISKPNPTHNYFLSGWTEKGVHVNINVLPATGANQEIYHLYGEHRDIKLSFPQNNVVDYPGYIEVYEKNTLQLRKTAEDFQIEDKTFLAGIEAEYRHFTDILNGEKSKCNLRSTLQTQMIKDALVEILNSPKDKGGVIGEKVLRFP